MISYKDMTFCEFFEDCKDGEGCFRALTDTVRENAEKWFGTKNPPISKYIEKPDCFKD